MTFRVLPYHLRVFSALLTNVTAGILLTLPTYLGNALVLTGNIFFGIICIMLALWFERIMDKV